MPSIADQNEDYEDDQANSALRASALLKAMGNKHRLMILCHLSETEACVSALEKVVGLSQSALSQHLAKLRHENLVKTRRHAQTIYYSLSGLVASEVIKTLRTSAYDPCKTSAEPQG
jgi:DNA-binding transcriptional ArsR family regulator